MTRKIISEGDEQRLDPAPTERRGLAASILAFVLSVIFLAAGLAKLTGLQIMVASFERWGYASWLMYAVGAVEVIGGILIAIPGVRAVGAAVIAVVMIGAIGTHVLAAEWWLALVPLAVLAAALALVFPTQAPGFASPKEVAPGRSDT